MTGAALFVVLSAVALVSGVVTDASQVATAALVFPGAAVLVLSVGVLTGVMHPEEWSLGGIVKGRFDLDDLAFRQFATPEEERLREFAWYMRADGQDGSQLVAEALKRTRFAWRRSAAANPLRYALGSLLELLEDPHGWRRFHPPDSDEPSRPGKPLPEVPELRRMEFEERAAYVLSMSVGLSHAEVAELLDCDRAAVGELLARARRRFEVADAV